MTTLDKTFTAVLVRTDVQAVIGKQPGDTVTVHLDERIAPPARWSTR